MHHPIFDLLKSKLPVNPMDYVGRDSAQNEKTAREGFASKAKRFLNKIPLAHETVAMYFAMLDPKTPVWVKATAGAALAYFILPLDAIPDFVPILGLGDDAGVLAAAISAVSAHVTQEHRNKASDWMMTEELAPEGVFAKS